MSLATTQSLFQYAIASLGQVFSPACAIQNQGDFVVWYTSTLGVDTLLVLNTDYTVTGAATSGVILSPSVTLEGTGLHYAVGGTLTIQRKNAFTQPTAFIDGTKYLAAVQNNSLDWLCYSIQALTDISSRCLQVSPTSPVQNPIALASRKNQLAGWDANGNFVTYPQSLAAGATIPNGMTVEFLSGSTLKLDAGATFLSNVGGVFDTGAGARLAPPVASQLLLGSVDGGFNAIHGDTYGNSFLPGLYLTGRSMGGTRAAPSATPSGTALIQVLGYGYDTAPTTSAAGYYKIQANSLWSAGNREVAHLWNGTPSGSITQANWMTLTGVGLAVTGALSATGSITSQGHFLVKTNPDTFTFQFQNTSGVSRWQWYPSGTETGSNAGSDLAFTGYSDTGIYLGVAMKITRATGAVTMPLGGGLAVTGALSATGNTILGNAASSTYLQVKGFNADANQALIYLNGAADRYILSNSTGISFFHGGSQIGQFSSTGLAVTGTISTSSTTLHTSTVALTNGAAAAAGTLTNAPVAGNPTKWVPIVDNGTTRYVPCW